MTPKEHDRDLSVPQHGQYLKITLSCDLNPRGRLRTGPLGLDLFSSLALRPERPPNTISEPASQRHYVLHPANVTVVRRRSVVVLGPGRSGLISKIILIHPRIKTQ